jgi:hypothetical protein
MERSGSLGSPLPNQKNIGCKLAPQLIFGQTAERHACGSAHRDGSNVLVWIKCSDDEDKKALCAITSSQSCCCHWVWIKHSNAMMKIKGGKKAYMLL